LIDRLYYPKLGNSSVWTRLSQQLVEQGVAVHKNTRVSRLSVTNNQLTGLLANDKQYEFDHIISTMPLGLLARLTYPDNAEIHAAASELKARSTVLVYLLAETGTQSELNWLSVYPPHYRMGRITDFGNWLGSNDGSTVYCIEYWCSPGDELWSQSDEQLMELAKTELERTDLFGKVPVVAHHVERLANTHPVFSLESKTAIGTLNSALSDVSGVTSVGRHGSHGVLGMGESMEAACNVADQVLQDHGVSLAR